MIIFPHRKNFCLVFLEKGEGAAGKMSPTAKNSVDYESLRASDLFLDTHF